ncbi:MAG: hypothetical protein U0414_36860 [Polyangiaceae bacterium]
MDRQRLQDVLSVFVVVLALAACGSGGQGADASATARSTATATTTALMSGDGSSREQARELALGPTVTGKLPCDGDKQSVWFRLVPGGIAADVKLELRTPKDGDQSCVHLSLFDAQGKLIDTAVSPCSDRAAEFAVASAPFRQDVAFLELRSSMGTCFTSDYRITIIKP